MAIRAHADDCPLREAVSPGEVQLSASLQASKGKLHKITLFRAKQAEDHGNIWLPIQVSDEAPAGEVLSAMALTNRVAILREEVAQLLEQKRRGIPAAYAYDVLCPEARQALEAEDLLAIRHGLHPALWRRVGQPLLCLWRTLTSSHSLPCAVPSCQLISAISSNSESNLHTLCLALLHLLYVFPQAWCRGPATSSSISLTWTQH